MNKQLLEQESKEKYPPTFETLGIRYDNPTHLALQKAYISGATSSSTVKELEERLESCLGVLVSIREDLPKDGLGKIFVEKEIELLKKILKH